MSAGAWPWERPVVWAPSPAPSRLVVREGRRRAERSAGVPTLEPIAAVPTSLPATSDFSRAAMNTADAAYWLIGTDLYQATAGQVLRDVREALSIPDSAAIYTEGMITRAAERARALDASVVLPEVATPGDGNILPRGWIRVFLWLTYSEGVQRLADVKAPLAVARPALNGPPWTDLYGVVKVYRGFDPRLLAVNPFANFIAEPTDVTTEPPAPTEPTWSGEGPPRGDTGTGESESGGGGVGLVLAALALLAGTR